MARKTQATEDNAPDGSTLGRQSKQAAPAERYTSSAVCAALGLPRTTYDAWMLRGYVSPQGPGTGRARLLDLETIIRLAIMKVGADFGVSPTMAGNWSNVCIMLMRDRVEFRYLHVRMYPGPDHETSYFPDDELMQDAPRPDPVLKLTLDIRQIVSSVRDALRKQTPAEISPPTEAKRKRSRVTSSPTE